MNWIVSENKTSVFNCILVKCIAEIRDNKTGEVREYETDELLEEGDAHPDTFNWEENNFSCDCNRRRFFKSVKGDATKSDYEMECSDGCYSVNLKNKKDGVVYYQEFEHAQEPKPNGR